MITIDFILKKIYNRDAVLGHVNRLFLFLILSYISQHNVDFP